MDTAKGYRQLLIYQKARLLVKEVYQVSAKVPKSENHGLISQVNRATVSVVLNIVEGHRRRKSQKEFIRFLTIADGSLAEVEACLDLIRYLDFITQDEYQHVELLRSEVAIMLTAFIKKVHSNL